MTGGHIGLLGGGVIGGGWAARFLLNGHDVVLFDPDPEAPRKVGEVLANARRANAKLTNAPWPAEGSLRIVTEVEAAIEGATFVQESAPERLELKQKLFAAASRVAGADVVFGSSTSGLLPTEMQRDMVHPERLVVGHPFNPVYLMPLVEVCGGAATSESTKQRAAEIYAGIGMHPLMLSKEIDGFVADRLMEALWREALWLVNDGVATAAEIDDAMRFGPGLRWSFMGTFLIYRIAGGEAGMRHFMAQFGPALKWPWTKLMDVPELTDELLDTICAQSDAQVDEQTPGMSIRELEALRDDCLVEVMHGLRNRGFAAGKTLADFEQTLFDRGHRLSADIDVTGPIRIYDRMVPNEWVDYNGHTNDSRYMQITSEAGDKFMRLIGVDEAYLQSGCSYYTVESHLNFIAQSHAGDHLYVTAQLMSHDPKRFHIFTTVRRVDDDSVVATAEHMMLHVDSKAGKSSPASAALQAKLAEIAAHHDLLPRPSQAGRAIAQPRT
ncbi:MAG: carnitine 3-dehydrogenase [Ilumatobacteraceae bacterium]